LFAAPCENVEESNVIDVTVPKESSPPFVPHTPPVKTVLELTVNDVAEDRYTNPPLVVAIPDDRVVDDVSVTVKTDPR